MKLVYNFLVKKICLKSFLILSVLISFGITKSLASSDIVILNTNNNKYHKVDCEYAKKKSMVVDGYITVIASTNWTGASEYSNDENMLIIKNENISQKQEREFFRLWKSIK